MAEKKPPKTGLEPEANVAGVHEAMLEELGISRLENLPMDDRPRVNNFHRANTAARRPTRPADAQISNTVTPGDTSLASIWQGAIEAGVFNDKDAEEAQDLDDLGGGRIYDLRNRAQDARDRTARIMAQLRTDQTVTAPGNARQGVQTSGSRGRNRNIPPGGVPEGRKKSTPLPPPKKDEPIASRNNQRLPTPVRPRSSPSSRSSAAQGNILRIRKMNRSHTVNNPALTKTDIAALASQNAHLRSTIKGPDHTIYKEFVVLVVENLEIPALLFLSVQAPPMMGSFDIAGGQGWLVHHGIQSWYNYMNDSSGFSAQFRDGNCVVTYYLKFADEDQVRRLLIAVASLREGKHSSLLGVTAPVTTNQDVTSTISATTLAIVPAGLTQENHQGPDSTPLEEADATRQLIDTAEDHFDVPTAAGTRANPDIHARDTPVSHLSLLATLDPVPDLDEKTPETVVPEPNLADPDHDSPLVKEARLLPEEELPPTEEDMKRHMKTWMIDTTRNILECFLRSFQAGNTKNDIAATVQGIKDGLVEDYMKTMEHRAAWSGLGEEQRASVLDDFLGISSDKPNHAPDEARASSIEASRPKYSHDELLALKSKATEPPSYLQNPEFIPRLKKPDRVETPEHPIDTTKAVQSMAWVRGLSTDDDARTGSPDAQDSEPRVGSAYSLTSDVLQKPEATVPRRAKRVPHKGLGKSRWMSPDISADPAGSHLPKHENKFTGLGYEFRPGTALFDLYNLSMGEVIAPGTDNQDILNLFVPRLGMAAANSAEVESNVPGNGVNVTLEQPDSSDSANSMEALSNRFAKLSAGSQRKKPSSSGVRDYSPLPSLGSLSSQPRSMGVEQIPVSSVVEPRDEKASTSKGTPNNAPKRVTKGLAASRHA